MNYEAENSSGKRTGAIILVLFILLVSVEKLTSNSFNLFKSCPNQGNDSSAILGTRAFRLFNQTANLTLQDVTVTGNASYSTAPVSPGAASTFNVVSKAFSSTSADVSYNVYRSGDSNDALEYVGKLSCTLFCSSVMDGAYFMYVSTSAPIRTASQQARYPDYIAKLSIYPA
ncbi:hypothetical protein M3223_11545 [Paenibacillus pasadenensis]|uniref:hypothetical protein n=1 Tax=Paenibacillus pasadenensis TaxID=217090 RepID=UPI00203EA62E|nr:hypothetical protein [Paenibacillus pasadenensis]MCM3747985.1 hypothetical protein [Paenibacillus pasadenensis]